MISLQPVTGTDIKCLCIDLGKEAAIRRAFPTLRHTSFQRSVMAAHKIQDKGSVRGVLFEIRPMNEFTAYGENETLLLIYPEFQRQGIATEVISMICDGGDERFFVSPKANSVSRAFFQEQRCLKLVSESDRYSVFKPLKDTRIESICF
jgi:hypothetical protein